MGWKKDIRHGLPASGYGEEAFRHLLGSEAQRSRRSGHLCQILLVHFMNAEEAIVPMGSRVADAVIAALIRTLRDTDYVGWYREGKIVGGVLTLLGQEAVSKGCACIRARVAEVLQSELKPYGHHRVRINVCTPDADNLREIDEMWS